VLGRFKEYSKDYSWMLTIAMVVATYGIAQELNISGAIAIFVFGIVLANIGIKGDPGKRCKERRGQERIYIQGHIAHKGVPEGDNILHKHLLLCLHRDAVQHVWVVRSIIAAGVVISIIAILARFLFAPLLKQYMSANDGNRMKQESWLIAANVPRGLSPAIIATLPLTMGIVIPGFLDTMFMTILFTNVVSTVAIFAIYRMIDRDAPMAEKKGSA
jgi:Sodium/hydrogen exchanger family.